MQKYNHLYSIAFSVASEKENASDVNADMLRAALRIRIANLLNNTDWLQACNNEQDTYNIEEMANAFSFVTHEV